MVREPIVADRFYPGDPHQCQAQLKSCIPPQPSITLDPGVRLCGAIVPHAGWMCSGNVTGSVLRALAHYSAPETIVLFGAVHRVYGRSAALYESGSWRTPLGEVVVDTTLAAEVRSSCDLVVSNEQAHALEHSLEVQIPFIQVLFPGLPIVPIMVPPSEQAHVIGQAVGQACARQHRAPVFIGTTDLTHYGPSYGMVEHGRGQAGLDWAKNENDRRMLECIATLEPRRIVPEAQKHLNACGPGAVAATMAACLSVGADRAILVEHTTSAETLPSRLPQRSEDAVGYGGFVFAMKSDGLDQADG